MLTDILKITLIDRHHSRRLSGDVPGNSLRNEAYAVAASLETPSEGAYAMAEGGIAGGSCSSRVLVFSLSFS